jgi:RNA-directed DNA polymerase
VQQHLREGFTTVYDADLQSYFDTIPHEMLLRALEQRLADGSVLRLIRMWLQAPVVGPGPDDPQGPSRIQRSRQGTPQGGVISPLLANVYLHWFDRHFHRPGGMPAQANARLVRYADDFVVLARYQGTRLVADVEGRLEGVLRLKINREKTRIVDLRQPGTSLDFLGYTFWYAPDRFGRPRPYLRVEPAKKTLVRERAKLREYTSSRWCFLPVPELVGRLNRHTAGWGNYFKLEYPRQAFRKINHYVRQRVIIHLRRRSQRGYRCPKGQTMYQHLQQLGLKAL